MNGHYINNNVEILGRDHCWSYLLADLLVSDRTDMNLTNCLFQYSLYIEQFPGTCYQSEEM